MSFTKKNLEQLAPSEISQQLRERVAQLNVLLDLKFRALKKAPEGSLRISQCRGDVQYYHRETPNDQCGHYIDAAHYELAPSAGKNDRAQRNTRDTGEQTSSPAPSPHPTGNTHSFPVRRRLVFSKIQRKNFSAGCKRIIYFQWQKSTFQVRSNYRRNSCPAGSSIPL